MEQFISHKKNKRGLIKKSIFIAFFCVILFFIIAFLYLGSSIKLKEEKRIIIPSGTSAYGAVEILTKESLLRSSLFGKILARQKSFSPKSGEYIFESGVYSPTGIFDRIELADYGDVYETLTIPEGSTNAQIADILQKKFSLSPILTLELINKKEGCLFPDTYSFLPSANLEEVVLQLEKTYRKKADKAFADRKIEKTEKELVIMASLLEKEAANDLEQKQIVAGILWKRIAEGIPLQVDAPFVYERGKGSADLRISDLRADSVYNTYTNKGLTPTAIGNPGYDSLYAAAHPIDSPYYFYLHAPDGSIHYGRNHDEHLKNKRMYLR